MSSRDKLKALIAQNKTKRVITQLLVLAKDQELNEEVVQQSAKFAQYEKHKRMGTLTQSELDTKLTRINSALLFLIDELHSPDRENKVETIPPNITKTSTKGIWQYIAGSAVIIGILAGIAEFSGFNLKDIFGDSSTQESFSVTVLVHGENGKDDILLPNRGIVYLIYGDTKIPEQINNEGEATFKQIPKNFFTDNAKIEITFEDPLKESYRVANRDTSYTLKNDTHISLVVVLEGMDQISGIVKDFTTGAPIDSAMVRVFGKGTYSNSYGEFVLDIPKDQQKQFVTLSASKRGYKTWEKKDNPTTTNQVIVIPLEKE